MQRRKKVGGITDRRFGETDPTMTPEERALERFVREKQKGTKKGSLFDLEDDEGDEGGLTHLGQSLSLGATDKADDFNEEGISISDEKDQDIGEERRPRKRRRLSASDYSDGSQSDIGSVELPDRVKTKQEVMKEVIAKSKLYKYERQKVKEDDDDLRAELDQGLSDIYALMRDSKRQPQKVQSPTTERPDIVMNPDRAALLNGKDRSQADKEYDERLRQMAFDQRSKPTVRSKTEDERLAEEARRLKELEEKRLRRMRGEEDSGNIDDGLLEGNHEGDEGVDHEEDSLGLGKGIPTQIEGKQLDVEDEDDFIIEDNLIADDSDLNISEDEDTSLDSTANESNDEEDREFVQGLLSKNDIGREGFTHLESQGALSTTDGKPSTLAFTYPCPQTHEELLKITESISIEDLPTVIQRIRALHHPRLDSTNKAKLGVFSTVLVDHIAFLANQPRHPPFTVMETLIRHIHSLAKSFPEEVGRGFRSHLKSLHTTRPNVPTPGDLIIFTAIATIFPTSDHFHPVVTPAILSMARILGQKIPQTLGDLAQGAYVGTLCLQYQRLSKRYIPELVNYTLNAISILAPSKFNDATALFPRHDPVKSLRIQGAFRSSATNVRRLQFWDVAHIDGVNTSSDEELKSALISIYIALVDTMAELWVSKSAFYEILEPFSRALGHLSSKTCSGKLNPTIRVRFVSYFVRHENTDPPTQEKNNRTSSKIQHLLRQARLTRRPLLLHNHRPLAIKSSIPKFEESYNPDKHYDPDRDRAELSKLKAEHKRERKGALRELRKDANFIARESLREKKERDSAYEKKYKRLVAEIQGEEGKEAKSYEREKKLRKARK